MAQSNAAPPALTSGSGTHAPGYLDGNAAEDAFQGLIDRGLFSHKAPISPAQGAPSPGAPVATTPEPVSTEVPAEPVQAEPAVEPEPYQSLDDYLTKAQLDRASFLELPVTVKVDGKESQIPLSSVLRSYQTDAAATQRIQAHAAKEKQWTEEQAQAKQVFTQQFNAAQQLTKLAHQQLLSEFQAVQWEQLKAQDPLQYTIKRGELNERYGAIQQQMQQLQQIEQQQATETQQRQAQQLQVEQQRMLEVFPEWRDPTKFQAARTELSSYAKTIGFNDAELAGIADHRYMKVLHDASRYAALQAKSPAVLKMVRSAPPMAAPGARTQRDPRAARLQQVREAGRAGKFSRNEEAQVAAFSALVDAGA